MPPPDPSPPHLIVSRGQAACAAASPCASARGHRGGGGGENCSIACLLTAHYVADDNSRWVFTPVALVKKNKQT